MVLVTVVEAVSAICTFPVLVVPVLMLVEKLELAAFKLIAAPLTVAPPVEVNPVNDPVEPLIAVEVIPPVAVKVPAAVTSPR